MSPDPLQAQLFEGENGDSVEINGDQVSFSMEENKVVATGNVEVIKKDATLLCDQLEFYRETKVAVAEGNVVLLRDGGRFTGDRLTFNFGTMQGDFSQMRVYSKPFFGGGKNVLRVDENHMKIDDGFLTTSDWDKPEYRIAAKKIDIYPGEKAVARHVRFMLGNIPIIYLPKFTQDLTNKKPMFVFTPGYDSDWGAFLLTAWNYKLSENFKGTVHVDYRQRLDLATGLDIDYNTKVFGDGIIRTYYTQERRVSAKHFFDERLVPTVERERFKAEWRHRWKIDEKTNAILQYFKLSDADFLRDFFELDADEDATPPTFFLFTHALPAGTFSMNIEGRVNRFVGATERLPEFIYDLPSTELAKTGFFWKSLTSYSNLVQKDPSPSEDRQKTMRVHTDNEISYPLKFAFLEVKPFVGGRETYYTRTVDKSKYDTIRGIFTTGAILSTKFYRIFDASIDEWGLDINRLRHVITPSVSYRYTHDPTVFDSSIVQIDGIDSQTRGHKIGLSLENKLQTKRDGKNVDLVRIIGGTDFLLKEDTGKGGFNSVSADIEVIPFDWLNILFDSSYDAHEQNLDEANVHVYIKDPKEDRWFFNLEKRFNDAVDDQIYTEWGYRINPKWKVSVTQRYDIDSGTLKEQEYSVERDLHSWVMSINFNETRGDDSEIWMVFTLKDFPDIGLDFGTRFNRRKPGAQTTSEEE